MIKNCYMMQSDTHLSALAPYKATANSMTGTLHWQIRSDMAHDLRHQTNTPY